MKYKNTFIIIGLFSILIASASYFWLKPKPVKLVIRETSFSKLPGWEQGQLKQSLEAFKISCKTFLKQDPDKNVGTKYFKIKVKDWHPICQEALTVDSNAIQDLKLFFEKWFVPIEFYKDKPVKGLFTGYYMPSIIGSPKKTSTYRVPIYGLPDNLITVNLKQFSHRLPNRTLVGRLNGKRVIPFYTRKEINNGAISKHAEVLAWIESPIDRIFLEIQGSGTIKMTNGTELTVGYIAQNGAPYTSIAKVLIDKGVMTKDNASMQHIRRYLDHHKNQIDKVLNRNESFVFFEVLKKSSAFGSQGVPLTPGYSLAIDQRWIPLGVPIWLNTTCPDNKSDHHKKFRRLMIAQDTGGAIRGVVRGDVYWGSGKKATNIAGRMKNSGRYWLLIPRSQQVIQ